MFNPPDRSPDEQTAIRVRVSQSRLRADGSVEVTTRHFPAAANTNSHVPPTPSSPPPTPPANPAA